MSLVAVVICNYNKRQYVIDCIDSVFGSNFRDFDLIVVDNASTDDSVDAIEERFGDKLTLLVNEENTGGSGGFNRGMQYAMDKGRYKYIHLLDNDVIIDADAIGNLYEFMEAHPEAGACGSLICKADDRDIIQEYGASIRLDTFTISGNYKDVCNDTSLPKSIECDYVAACSAMFRAEVLKHTGLMDTSYFIYWDDMALCWDVRNTGYKIYAFSESVVWHYGTFASRSCASRYYLLRNQIFEFTKYLDDYDFERFISWLTLRLFRIFAANRSNPEIIRAYFHAVDDAINNVRNKASDYKVSSPAVTRDIPDNMTIVNVPHVLDVGEYDHTAAYSDPYGNVLFGDADFKFVESIDGHFEFFQSIFGGFLKDKLNELRSQIRG